MNEVRDYLLKHRDPVPAEEIRLALGMSHERVYEFLVRLEAQGQAQVMQFGGVMGWTAV